MLKQAQNICQVQSDDDDKFIRALFGIKGYVSLDKNKKSTTCGCKQLVCICI